MHLNSYPHPLGKSPQLLLGAGGEVNYCFFFLFCFRWVCVVDGLAATNAFSASAERVKGDGRGRAQGRREKRGWGDAAKRKRCTEEPQRTKKKEKVATKTRAN